MHSAPLKRLLEVRRANAKAFTSLAEALRRAAPKAIVEIAREALPGDWRTRIDNQWITAALLPLAPGAIGTWAEDKLETQFDAAAQLTSQWNVDKRLIAIGMECLRSWVISVAQTGRMTPETIDAANQTMLLAEAVLAMELGYGPTNSIHKDLKVLRGNIAQLKSIALAPDGATLFPVDPDLMTKISDRLEKGLDARDAIIARLHARAEECIASGQFSTALSALEQVELQNLRLSQTKQLLEELAEAHAIRLVELSLNASLAPNPAGASAAGGSSTGNSASTAVTPVVEPDESSSVLSPDEVTNLSEGPLVEEEETGNSDLIQIDDPDEEVDDRIQDSFQDTSTGDLTASAIRVAGEFDNAKFHWMVTTELDMPRGYPLPYMIDENIKFNGLEIRRDIAVFNPNVLGALPQRGLHEIFLSQGKNINWGDAFRGWLSSHEKRLETFFEKCRGPLAAHEPTVGLAVIGKMGWHATYELTNNTESPTDDPLAYDNDYLDDWQDLIAGINKTWDPAFCRQMNFDIPEGTTGFGDLEGGQKRKHAKRKLLSSSWNYFSCALFLWTLRTCKRLFPQARWAFLGYPLPLSLADPTDVNAKMVVHQRINDKLKWLWQAQDAIIPNLLAHHYTIPDGKKPDMARKQNNASLDRKAVEYNIKEAIRVRDAYAIGKPVLSSHTYTYPASAKSVALNDINTEHQFRLPLDCGVDGILIRGHLGSRTQIDSLQMQLNSKLGKVIKDAIASRDQI
jgi:hypothetical protein